MQGDVHRLEELIEEVTVRWGEDIFCSPPFKDTTPLEQYSRLGSLDAFLAESASVRTWFAPSQNALVFVTGVIITVPALLYAPPVVVLGLIPMVAGCLGFWRSKVAQRNADLDETMARDSFPEVEHDLSLILHGSRAVVQELSSVADDAASPSSQHSQRLRELEMIIERFATEAMGITTRELDGRKPRGPRKRLRNEANEVMGDSRVVDSIRSLLDEIDEHASRLDRRDGSAGP